MVKHKRTSTKGSTLKETVYKHKCRDYSCADFNNLQVKRVKVDE